MRRILSFLIILFFLLADSSPASVTSQEKTKNTELLASANRAVGARLGNYSLIDQDDNKFSLSDYLGKPFILNLIYTNCVTTCGISTVILAEIIKDAGRELGQEANQEVNIITVSFDYERDTSQSMKEYGENFTKDFKHWRFAVGDKDTIKGLTNELGFYYQKTKKGFDHINMISVIDLNGKVYNNVFYGSDHNNEKIKNELIGSLKGALSGANTTGNISGFTGIIDAIKLMCNDYDPVSGAYRISYLYLSGTISGILFFTVPIIIIWRKELLSLFNRIKDIAAKIGSTRRKLEVNDRL